MSPRFLAQMQRTFKFEGGYVNDPDDPGGETKYGISKRSFPRVDIKNLTKKQAEDIYWRYYWLPLYDVMPERVGQKVFDLAINTGRKRAHQFLQKGLRSLGYKISVDGVIGQRTMVTIENAVDADADIYGALVAQAETYYRNLARRGRFSKYLRGWLRRLEEA